MSEYFSHDVKLKPGTRARADDVNSRFDQVAVGFDKLPNPHLTEDGFRDPLNVGPATLSGHAITAGQAQVNALTNADDSGTVSNQYEADLAIAPASYTKGLSVILATTRANTGPATINLNSLGAKSLVRTNGDPLRAGDVGPGMVTACYDGTRFVVTSFMPGVEAAMSGQLADATQAATDAAADAEATEADRLAVAADRILAETARTGAQTARGAAETAQAAAETAASFASSSASGAGISAGDASTSAGLAGEFMAGAETAQTAAEAAQAAAESARDDVLAGVLITSSVTYTVGSGGDYVTINAALADLTAKRPIYAAAGITVTLNLLSGFVMAEQVHVKGIDLSWVNIGSVDSSVPITSTSLTTYVSAIAGYTAFLGENAKLPRLSTDFILDTSGSIGNYSIYALTDNAHGFFENVSLTATNLSGSTAVIKVFNGSKLVINGGFTVSSNTDAFRVRTASDVVITSGGANITGITTVSYGSRFQGRSAIFSGSVTADSSFIDISGSTITVSSAYSVISSNGSNVRAITVVSTGHTIAAFRVTNGGTISMYGGTYSTSQAVNILTASGVIFR